MKYEAFIAANESSGAALGSPICTVRVSSSPPGNGALASLFDFSGAPMSNPFVGSSSGLCAFRVADGKYDIQFTAGAYVAPIIAEYQIVDEVAAGGGATWTDLALATTTDLGSVGSGNIHLVSGSAGTVTGFGSTGGSGTTKRVRVGSAFTLTYNAASMLLPGNASIAMSVGDSFTATSLGSGNWQVLDYTPGVGGYFSRDTAGNVVVARNTSGAFTGSLIDLDTPNTAATAGANALNVKAAGVEILRVDMNGKVFADGGVAAGGAGFAEYIEWLDGNPLGDDRTGWTVSLRRGKLVRAKGRWPWIGPIGVVTARAAYVGNDTAGRKDDPTYAAVSGLGQEYVLKGERMARRWTKLKGVGPNMAEWWIR